MHIIFLLVILATISFGCRKKTSTHTIASKIAGTHIWTGTQKVYSDYRHNLDTSYSITFSTVLYALDDERIMFFDSDLHHMDELSLGYIDTAAKIYWFGSDYNIMVYSLSDNSIEWNKHFLDNGKYIEWDLFSLVSLFLMKNFTENIFNRFVPK